MKIRYSRWLLLALLLCLTVGLSFFYLHRVSFLPTKIDTEPVSDVLLSTTAGFLVVQKEPSAISSSNGSGVLDAYQHEPEAFKRDARLVKTLIASSDAANYVRQSGANLPVLSNESPFVTPILDPWGKPLCITGTKTEIVVVSDGGNEKAVRCASGELPAKLLQDIPRNRLIKTERGYLISIFPRSQP